MAISIAAGVLIAVPVLPAPDARAASATFTVTSTADSGAGSLRQAIVDAESTADDDTIVFDASFSTPQTITLSTALPTITKPLTIIGPGQDLLTIDGGGAVRPFYLVGDGTVPPMQVNISDLTIDNGAANKGAGAYLMKSEATFTRVTLSNNASTSSGGALQVEFSGVTLIDSTLEDNSAATYGGGIYTDYTLVDSTYTYLDVRGSTIQRNAAASGGGIFAFRSFTLTDDTIADNSATGWGGGIYQAGSYANSITRTSLTGNTAAVAGGALALGPSRGYRGQTVIDSSDISGNSATNGNGVAIISTVASIVNSTVDNGAGADCYYAEEGVDVLAVSSLTATTGSTFSDNTCNQLSRGGLATAFSAGGVGTPVILNTLGDPDVVMGDKVIFCKPSRCRRDLQEVGTVSAISTADDTFAVTVDVAVTSFTSVGDGYVTYAVQLPMIFAVSPDSGVAAGGTSVTITGFNFGDPAQTPAVAASFAGTAATSVTHVDDTTMTVVTPAGSGAATVTVSSDANTATLASNSLADAFTYPGSPSPPAPTPTPTPPPTYPSSAPLAVAAVAGDASASVSWGAPASGGSFAVTNYQVTSSPAGGACLTTDMTCEIKGLTNGTAYTFTVRALNGAGWSTWSAPSTAVTPAADDPAVTITIIGSRGQARAKREVTVSGRSTGLEQGAILRPWMRFPGQTTFTQGTARILVDGSGTFEWSRRTGKMITVYITTADGLVASNRVTIYR